MIICLQLCTQRTNKTLFLSSSSGRGGLVVVVVVIGRQATHRQPLTLFVSVQFLFAIAVGDAKSEAGAEHDGKAPCFEEQQRHDRADKETARCAKWKTTKWCENGQQMREAISSESDVSTREL